MRRRTAAVMATILAATLGATPVLADELSVFNSKSEIEEQMEDMASDYSDENDVDMEVYYSQDTVAAHLSTKYASKDPYVLSMVDAKDIYSLGPDHALDLSDQPWVKDSSQIIRRSPVRILIRLLSRRWMISMHSARSWLTAAWRLRLVS